MNPFFQMQTVKPHQERANLNEMKICKMKSNLGRWPEKEPKAKISLDLLMSSFDVGF
jgi:hypothetical protein